MGLADALSRGAQPEKRVLVRLKTAKTAISYIKHITSDNAILLDIKQS
ncbi:hypothetical protein SAMN02982989_0093 [Xaviernesmea oryzae]|uniref:Uncharacterized protein n=1 Tax=Xaviernesmea oryzae TaxID=464029 RepID=A0A1X7FPB5_9HYPH|nr:hypothetical protein SAMN02982989_0093 [Xaviernesmea oryzae]